MALGQLLCKCQSRSLALAHARTLFQLSLEIIQTCLDSQDCQTYVLPSVRVPTAAGQ